ncbi:hypothetical protein LCGC14_0207890 [marine sediment metagenome]|uniref:Uncharacterized protein n=1 Tax=marine sediment metagenome TaxID=412755 RepID=A0A0F9XJQ8_9ZZZZ
MFHRFFTWFETFQGALFAAVWCLLAMVLQLSDEDPSTGWAIAMAACVMWWVYKARKALKNKSTNKVSVKLTNDQEQRIKEATEAFHATMKEVELELTQAMRVAEEKDVQSNRRADQEDGTERDD